MKFLIVFIAIACLVAIIYSKDCPGQVNTKPFIYDDPVLVDEIPNGRKYFVGQKDGQFTHLVHVHGSAYDMGHAYGTLLKHEIAQTTSEYMQYLESMVADLIKYLPKKIAELIAQFGINVALDLTYEATRRYTPQHYEDELRGIADASGVDYKVIRRLNLIPELFKAHCSIVGVWGDAHKNSTGGANPPLIQLRALDWDSRAVIKRNPVVTVYHPLKGHKFVNAAWPGFIGSLTGISDKMIGIGEKVWIHDEDYDTRFGKPWTYVLRDILQFAESLEDAMDILKKTDRTCSIHLGIGDSAGKFRGVQYSYKHLSFYNWDDQYISEGHPRLKDVVYWDKHVQPSNRTCLGPLLQENHGKIDAETLIRNIAAVHETGDMQCAVFDYGNEKLYISNASPNDEDPFMQAYKRGFLVLDLKKLFQERF